MLVLALASALARATPTSVALPTASWCFPSGFRVMFERSPGRASVSVVSVIDGGSSGDPPDRAGLAHFVEHLWFRTARMEALQRATGARTNAFTTLDETQFTTTASRRFVRSLLDAEVARFRDPLAEVTTEVVDPEREIVRNELRQRYDDTAGRGVLALFDRLFPEDDPYHRATIGTHASIAALDLDAARAYAAEWYTPAHTTWYVSGDFSFETVERLIREVVPVELRAGADPAGAEPTECAPRPVAAFADPGERPEAPIERVAAVVSTPTLAFGWAFPPGEPAASMARFDLWIVEGAFEEALARPAQCAAYGGARATAGYCFVELEAGEDADRLLKKGMATVDRWWSAKRREELRRAYNRYSDLRRDEIFDSLEQMDGATASRPLEAAVHFHRSGDPDQLGAELATLTPRDPAEEARFGERWATGARLAAVVLEPAPAGEWPVTLHSLRDHPDPPRVDALTVDRDRLGTFAVEPDLARLVEKELPNGLTVHLLPFGALPTVRAEVVLLADHEPQVRVADQYARYALALGARDRETWVRSGLSAFSWGRTDPDPVNALARLYGTVERMQAKTEKPSKALRDAVLAYVDDVGQRAAVRAEVARTEHLFADHPPSRDEIAAALARLTREELVAARDEILDPRHAHLFVVGGFDPDALLPWIERSLGTWAVPWTFDASPRAAPPPPTARAVAVFPGDDTVLSTVVAACRIDGDETPAERDVLAGLLNTALTDRLRKSAGATYGVEVRTVHTALGSLLEARTQVPHPAVGLTVATILDAWAGAARGVDADVLAAVKLAAAKRTAVRWQTTWEMLGWMETAVSEGAPVRAISGVAAQLDAVTAAGLAEHLGPCIGAEVVTVVGDAERAGASLDAAGVPFALVATAPAP